jgi:uncharacterized protein YecE (DUF72 family)
MNWYIGCSGFHYKEWKEIFYPKGLVQKKWFEYYASQFDTLELNVTFYRFPQLSFLQRWYDNSPAGFRFAVKAPRLITHYKRFNDCRSLLDDFYLTVGDGLKEKLGTILFQLPPKYGYDPEKLELIISQLNNRFLHAIEFRDISWWNKKVQKKLQEAGIIFTGISHPTLPGDVVINNETVYYRFHGVPKLYYSSYGNNFLKKIADKIGRDKKVKDVYLYFNNTADVAAIENANWIKKYVQETFLKR